MKPASHHLDRGRDFGLLVVRIVIGLTFVYYGWTKIMAGSLKWEGVGSAVGVFGLTEGHLYWGLAAALVEFLGGIALVFGFFVRPAAFLLFFVMVVATVLKSGGLDFSAGDSVSEVFYPASMAAVMVMLFFSGGGRLGAGGRGRKTSTVDPKQSA
jgi:putative oxidoreductase